MVGRIGEIQWAWAAASTVAADMTLKLPILLK